MEIPEPTTTTRFVDSEGLVHDTRDDAFEENRRIAFRKWYIKHGLFNIASADMRAWLENNKEELTEILKVL